MKALFTVVAFCTSMIFAQEQSSQIIQNDSSLTSSTMELEVDEIILGDDEDILKAQQLDTTTNVVTPEESPFPANDIDEDIISTDGELKLDGGEESLFEPVKPDTELMQDSGVLTSEKGVMSQQNTLIGGSASDTSNQGADRQDEKIIKGSAPIVLVVTDSQKVEKAGSINFARNLKEYRSPKLAMLLSLFVPGAGQIYARHNSWKAAVYGVVEAGMVGASVAVHYKGKGVEEDAYNFADKFYSYDKYFRYQELLRNKVSDSVFATIFLGADTTFQKDAIQKNNDYYRSIKDGNQPFVNGWESVLPDYDENMDFISTGYEFSSDPDRSYLVYPTGGDTIIASFGFSEQQKNYSSQLSKARGYFDKSNSILTLMLLNHIVSAVDAGFTAKAYNDLLLQKESFWQRIEIDRMYVSTGSGMIPGYSFKVRF